MKNICTLPLGIFLVFCQLEFTTCHSDVTPSKKKNENIPRVIVPEWKNILDSNRVKGAVLVYDPKGDTMYSNDFAWCDLGFLPASTFKITNSIIALESGVIEDDSTLIKWDGSDRRLDSWEKDMLFKDAFRESCVPCYQEIARQIGVRRMKTYLDKLDYGHMVVDSSNIDMFWLEGDSKISMIEQVRFLQRLNESNLPINTRTEKIMKRILLIDETEEYKISGKTGWAIRNDLNNGWFVGYIETKGQTWYFATNVEPEEDFNMEMFGMIRTNVTMLVLQQMGLIN